MSKLIVVIFGIFCILIYLTFVMPQTGSFRKFIIPNWSIFVIALAILLMIAVLFSRKTESSVSLRESNLKSENRILFIVSALLLLFQLGLIYMTAFRTGWDPGAVHYGANYAALHDTDGMKEMAGYFSYYPNNLFLTFLFSIIYKINYSLGTVVSNGLMLPVFVQAFISTATGAVTYRCSRRFLSASYSWVVYVLYVILVGTSPWLVIAYSDSTGLIFPILIFYLYLKWRESEEFRLKWVILIGITSVVGFKIKPMALIVLIAICMVEFVVFIKEKRSFGKILTFVLVLSISCGVTLAICNMCVESLHYELNSEKELGITHHLMLGMNKDSHGGYNQPDFDYSDSFEDKEIRQKAELERVKERISEYGVGGLVQHGFNKLARIYTDGMFGWGGVDGFYLEVYPERDSVICPILRKLYYDKGYENNVLFEIHALLRNIIWSLVLIGMAGTVIIKEYKPKFILIILALVGLMSYEMIFEAHPRYLFTYVPLFIIAAVVGYRGWLVKIWTKASK